VALPCHCLAWGCSLEGTGRGWPLADLVPCHRTLEVW
jgi:hypothetical protein